MALLDKLRTTAHRGITSPLGNGALPIRLSKDLLQRANRILGEPLCSAEDLAKRQAAAARLAELRRARAAGTVVTAPRAKVQAPVTVYFEKDRNVRELGRIEELLASNSIEVKRLDVAGDENTLDFVMRTAKVKQDELPVVFVADRAIGGYTALVDADVSGELARLAFPAASAN